MAPIKVCILGTGSSLSGLHYPSIASMPDKFLVHSVLERTPRGTAQAVCGPGVKVVQTLEEAVNDPEIELVVVTTPNNTHHAYTTAALNAGKHVLVEKPITPGHAEAEDLVKLAASKNLILTVYQNRRWDSDFLTVQKLLSTGRLGEINEFESSCDRYRPLPPGHKPGGYWKETPGENNDVVYSLGSHTIDQAYVLFGMPSKVGARMWDVRGIGVDESFVMDLYYPRPNASELVVTLRASVLSPLPSQIRYSIKGSTGSFVKYGMDIQFPHLQSLGQNKGASFEGYGKEPEDIWGTVYETNAEGTVMGQDGVRFNVSKYESLPGDWPKLYRNLHGVIVSGDRSKLAVKPEETVDVLKLIDLGNRSSKEGRVIPVSES